MDNNTLQHYGVPGMKWGKRRYTNSDGSLNKAGRARQQYKSAKKSYKFERKAAQKAYLRSWGIEGIKRANQARERVNAADMKVLNSKIAFKAAKAKNKAAAEKAILKGYTNAMYKTGLPGSALDEQHGNRSTRIYNSLVTKKGKKYADGVVKKVQNRTVATLVGSAAVAVGGAVAQAYMLNR